MAALRPGLHTDGATEVGMEEGMTVGDFQMRKYVGKRGEEKKECGKWS